MVGSLCMVGKVKVGLVHKSKDTTLRLSNYRILFLG